MVWGTREQYRTAMLALGFTGWVQTSLGEGVNTYLRESIVRSAHGQHLLRAGSAIARTK